jgi:hypothetical protein
MVISSVVLLGLMLAGLFASLYALARALNDRAVCDFRTALWNIHDEIVDDLVAERFIDPDRARALLLAVRSFIVHAPDLTALRVFGGYALVRVGAHARATIALANRYDPAWDGEAEEAVERYRERVAATSTDHLFRSSVGGRVALLLVPFAFALGRLFWPRSSSGTRLIDPADDLAMRPLRVEVDIEDFIDKIHGQPLLGTRAC